MAKVVRRDDLEGVSIKVVLRENNFDVFVTIHPGAYLWHERKCDCYWIRFATDYKLAPGNIRFKATRQGYENLQNSKEFKKTFGMREGGRCIVSLYPEFLQV